MLIEREGVSRSKIHRALIALGFVMLFWPAATTNLFGDGLAGYEPSSPAPRASLSDWFGGEFQGALDQWWKERFGMRFFFVKLDNQMDFWLFGRLASGESQIVYGKKGWLYERAYVDAYCRLREASDEAGVRESLAGVRALQDALDARGVPFAFLLDPSKAAIYPEWIPDAYCTPHESAGLEYDPYRPLLDEYGIRYVDGYSITQAAKALWPGTTLFARGGTHWNNLGAYYSAEALLEKVRPLSTKPIPPLVLGEVTFDNRPNRFDQDLVAFQNLLFPDTDFQVSHPRFSMERPEGRGLRVALVGMSFLEQIAEIFAASGGFDRVDHYWYYHVHVLDAVSGEWAILERERIDWEETILAADAVFLDMNMLTFDNQHVRDFVEDGLAHLGGEGRTRPRP